MKVKVDLLAGLDLRHPAAGRAPLHAEYRPQRRLAGGDDRSLPNAGQPLGKTDGGHSLPLAGGGGRSRSDQYQLAPRRKRGIGEYVQLQLGAITSDGLEIIFW